MDDGEHHYFVLRTPDLAASSTFFGELLGWRIENGGPTNVAFFGSLSEDHDRAIWVHVNDLDAACATVRELGGKPGDITDADSGRNAICDDDQGNTFHMGTLIPEFQDYPHPEPLEWGELGYFTMPVGDTTKAVAFYGHLFGWTFTEPGDAGIQAEYRHCTNGSLPFGFTADGDVSPSYYFRVADAEAIRARVAELGGEHGAIIDSDSGRTLTGCADPVGVRFELWQPAEGF